MTLDEFKEQYDGAPISLEDLALEMAEVDDEVSQKPALRFLDALRELEGHLKKIGVELG